MSDPADRPAPLPVTVIGGYLGSGKTTMVNHLLRHADGRKLAVLVNEFGELPIDADLIEAEDENLISIAGGCVCCSYGNDLVLAMLDLAKMEPRPDHVLLEASGVALPGAIAATVGILPDYALGGVIVLADAETVQRRASDRYLGDTIHQQLADADIIVLNRTDLVAEEQHKAVSEWLATGHPHARQVSTSRGRLPPELLLGFRDGGKALPDPAGPLHGDHHQLVSVAVTPPGPVDARAVAEALTAPELGLLRAKGMVNDHRDGPTIIQTVGRRAEVVPAQSDTRPGLVCIALRHVTGDAGSLTEKVNRIFSRVAQGFE